MIDLIQKIESFLQFSRNGYPEHFIGGILIGFFFSFLVLKKTKMIWIAVSFGIGLSIVLGLIKELIDPFLQGDRNLLDLIFTGIGGLLGSVSFYFFQKHRKSKVKKS